MISSESNSELNINVLTDKDQGDSQELDHLLIDQDDDQELDHLMTDQNDGQETDHLMIGEDQDGSTSRKQEESDSGKERTTKRKRPMKLLLIRIPWFVVGFLILVTGLVLSQYSIDLPYQPVEECDEAFNDTNSTMIYNDTLSV